MIRTAHPSVPTGPGPDQDRGAGNGNDDGPGHGHGHGRTRRYADAKAQPAGRGDGIAVDSLGWRAGETKPPTRMVCHGGGVAAPPGTMTRTAVQPRNGMLPWPASMEPTAVARKGKGKRKDKPTLPVGQTCSDDATP